MIHRQSRDNLAQALRQFAAGLIINDELEDIQVDYRDHGVAAIHDISWLLYDDLHKHRARGKYKLPSETRNCIKIWIAFLYSDNEFENLSPPKLSKFDLFMIVITFGLWLVIAITIIDSIRWKRFFSNTNENYWPFKNQEQLEEAIKHPKLLASQSPTT